MELHFRWYAEQDSIPLEHIRQIPKMQGIVTALYDMPGSQHWPLDRLQDLKNQIENEGMKFIAVESLPVHEDIKLGRNTRDQLIEIYQENIRTLGRVGIKIICYNFMPLFDWFRTNLNYPLPDGSTTMQYDESKLDEAPDPWETKMPAYFALDESVESIKTEYLSLSEHDLWSNFQYFLEAIVPVAQEQGIKMAVHPDDPPWSIFGLPRIIKNADSLRRLLKIADHPANGLTFCTGSFGADPVNDLPAMIREFGERIHFAHIRNMVFEGKKRFYESSHAEGDLPLLQMMQAYVDIEYQGPMRPDHGRMIWGETGQPGYGLYDRALGASYLMGIWEALTEI
jgi:mannonate dehydratase